MKAWKKWQHKTARPTRRVEFCPVMYRHAGQTYSAFMVDLSTGGAMLRSAGGAKPPDAGTDEEVDLDIKTPYGPSSCRARVLWREEDESGSRWGVKFTRLSADHSDPLNCLIESAL